MDFIHHDQLRLFRLLARSGSWEVEKGKTGLVLFCSQPNRGRNCTVVLIL